MSARGEYLTYRTLTAETKALEATRQMLQKRDEVLRTYLSSLRLKLVETTGISNYQQNLVFVKLDAEVSWLASHKDLLTSPGSLADLVKVSSDLEEKYPDLEFLIYQTLGTILSGKENSLREKSIHQADSTQEIINRMKSEGESVEKLERWLIEARKKITLSEQKQTEAESKIKALKESDYDRKRKFDDAQFVFEEANQYLKEAAAYLGEIASEIKYE